MQVFSLGELIKNNGSAWWDSNPCLQQDCLMVKLTCALYHTATLLTHHHHWSFFLYKLHSLISLFVFGTFFFRKNLTFLTDYSPLCISTTRYFSCATKLAISKSPSDYCMTPILEKNFKKEVKG